MPAFLALLEALVLILALLQSENAVQIIKILIVLSSLFLNVNFLQRRYHDYVIFESDTATRIREIYC
jgi:hypothetical protein